MNRIVEFVRLLKRGIQDVCKLYILNHITALGYKGSSVMLMGRIRFANPKKVFLYEYTRLQDNTIILNSTGSFIMKKYSGASRNLTVITGNHTPTVGIPQYLLPLSGINDRETDIIVEEDVWIGINVTLLAGTTIGRGAVVGACSLVNRVIPAYAVVVGTPAKIVASRFTVEEILEHEQKLYPVSDRLSESFLNELFKVYYDRKRSIGINSKTADDETQIELLKKKYKCYY